MGLEPTIPVPPELNLLLSRLKKWNTLWIRANPCQSINKLIKIIELWKLSNSHLVLFHILRKIGQLGDNPRNDPWAQGC